MNIDERIEEYKCYQHIIDEVTVVECIQLAKRIPIGCNREEMIREAIIQKLAKFEELESYKNKMEMQYLDDIDNPLEPLKLTSALQSEIFKYEYRKANRPKDINPLDYTVMYALKHCLEEQNNE